MWNADKLSACAHFAGVIERANVCFSTREKVLPPKGSGEPSRESGHSEDTPNSSLQGKEEQEEGQP